MYGDLMMYFHPQEVLPMETLTQCPLCGCSLEGTLPFDTNKIYMHDLAPGSEIVMCEGCGIVLQKRRLAEEGWEQYNEAFPSDGKIRWDHNAYRFKDELERIAHHCAHHANILDVGCGFGELTKLLQDKGYAAEGIDIRGDALRFGKQSHGLILHKGFYNRETARKLGKRFDAIVSVHAFEHFHDPLETLRAMHDNLKQGGTVFLTVPDTEPMDPEADGMPFDFYTSGHPFYYDRFTLRYILESAGFDITDIKRGADAVSERPVLRVVSKRRFAADGHSNSFCPHYTKDDLIEFQTNFILRREEAILENVGLKKPSTVAVYGAWLYGLLTANALTRRGHQVAMVVDSNQCKWGHLLAGHQIQAPEEMKDASILEAVIITSIGAFDQIKNYIRRHLGLRNLPLVSIAGGIIGKKHGH